MSWWAIGPHLKPVKTESQYLSWPRTGVYVKNSPSWIATVQETTDFLNKTLKPDELFLIIKEANLYEFLEKKRQRDMAAYLKTKNISSLNDITGEHENRCNELLTDFSRRYKDFMMLFTQKSTNPEVIKIEQDLKEMGIRDVNLSDDLEQAKLIKEAMQDLINGKIQLPHSIVVTPMLPKHTLGCANNYIENGAKNRYIFLATSEETKTVNNIKTLLDRVKDTFFFSGYSTEYQQKYLEEMNEYFAHNISTNNPKHFIYHEIRHTLENNTIRGFRTLNEVGKKIAEGVSICAKDSISEFKSEAFAKLMNGEKLTDEQMQIYMVFDGGIVPHFIKD